MGDQLRRDRLADGDAPEAVERDIGLSYTRLTGAPTLIVLGLTLDVMDVYLDPRRAEAEKTMAIQSVAMAAQNLLLAAHAEGLGACWLCAPLFCADVVRTTLALPEAWQPQSIITLGYPANNGKPPIRKALDEVVLWK
jgi:F420 biosynthesis protein FbiB-like protein